VRVFGTLLAAQGCFTVATWFLIYVVNTGFLENPKPSQTPLDSAKSALLWIQAMIALVAGLFLLVAATGQSKSNDKLALTSANESHRSGSRAIPIFFGEQCTNTYCPICSTSFWVRILLARLSISLSIKSIVHLNAWVVK